MGTRRGETRSLRAYDAEINLEPPAPTARAESLSRADEIRVMHHLSRLPIGTRRGETRSLCDTEINLVLQASGANSTARAKSLSRTVRNRGDALPVTRASSNRQLISPKTQFLNSADELLSS
ncbi:hypothetical protein CDAR_546781 [Caerostris darwini]|uniref:Uncharacterized protein n=1 Tax=Caerostris darwini TaxID=1538125 RepID=A0AAV4WSF8_9ARAC|nr:hypothetical protein CDAR_546781 [Caerostris darwini]